MYAKLENNILHFAPKKLFGDEVVVYNPPQEMYLEQGWKIIQYNPQPSNPPTGYYYDYRWEESDDEIIQVWFLKQFPDDISDEEAYNIIFGEE